MNNTTNIIYTVFVDDYADYYPRTNLDSLWHKWEDAAKRVKELNDKFEQDDEEDLHSYYCEGVVQ